MMITERLRHYVFNLNFPARVGLLCGLAFLMGCASPQPSKVPSLPSGVALHRDKDIEGVWLAAGFDFKGYDALYIAPPVFAAVERPNEVQMRAIALRVLPEQLTEHLRATTLFATVTANAEELKPGTKSLRMENTILEYEKGGGAGRYFVGVFGGGQPVLKVRGKILDGDKLMCVYEMKRSGESAGSRVAGVWMSDEEIQWNDIRDLASDLSDFFKRTAQVP